MLHIYLIKIGDFISWNKNTLVLSDIDNTIEVLKETGTPYTLVEIGKVNGMGLNDDIQSDDIKQYPIRRLEYKTFVVLEQLQRTPDCDSDDWLISKKFKKGEEPKKWELEVMLKVE